MKLKLGIIYGLLTWFFIHIIIINIHPMVTDETLYTNLIIPLSIVIIAGFFGILYIREINESEAFEGIMVGVLFVVIDFIMDAIFFIAPHNLSILTSNYMTHMTIILLMIIIVTSFLGYLAQMNIELK